MTARDQPRGAEPQQAGSCWTLNPSR